MRFDGWNTMEGRHLVYAYATVLILHLGYAGYVGLRWLKLAPEKKKLRSRISPTAS